MTDLHLVVALLAGLALLVCITLVVLAVLNRSCSAEHDLKRRGLAILAAMTGVPIAVVVATKSLVSGLVAVAVMIAWSAVMITIARLVFRVDPPP